MTNTVDGTVTKNNDEQLKELASLARLVAYARENAKELNSEFSVYCLDLALGALLQDLENNGINIPAAAADADDIPHMGTMH